MQQDDKVFRAAESVTGKAKQKSRGRASLQKRRLNCVSPEEKNQIAYEISANFTQVFQPAAVRRWARTV